MPRARSRRRGILALDRSRWNMLDADVVGWSRVTGSSHHGREP
jgi:hypothetical protein